MRSTEEGRINERTGKSAETDMIIYFIPVEEDKPTAGPFGNNSNHNGFNWNFGSNNNSNHNNNNDGFVFTAGNAFGSNTHNSSNSFFTGIKRKKRNRPVYKARRRRGGSGGGTYVGSMQRSRSRSRSRERNEPHDQLKFAKH
eukprot:889489_1